MRRRWVQWRSAERSSGQIIVEMAMVAPIFFFLTLGLIDAARYVYIRGVLTARVEAAARALTNNANIGSDCTVMAMMTSSGNAIKVDADPKSVAGDATTTQAAPYVGTAPSAGSGSAYIWPAVASSTPTAAACTWSAPTAGTPGGFPANSRVSPLRNTTGAVSAQIRYKFQPWTPVVGAMDIVVTATLPAENFGASRSAHGLTYTTSTVACICNPAIWFTEYSANKIGRLDTVTNQLTEYDVTTTDSGPWAIKDIGSSIPYMYFTEERANQIGRICWNISGPCTKVGQFLNPFTVPTANSGPRYMEEQASSPAGMWFGEWASGKIGFLKYSSSGAGGTIYEAPVCSTGSACRPDFIEVNPQAQGPPYVENEIIDLHSENSLVDAYYDTSTSAIATDTAISLAGVAMCSGSGGCAPDGFDHNSSNLIVSETIVATGGAGLIGLTCSAPVSPVLFAKCQLAASPNTATCTVSSAPEDLQIDSSGGGYWMVEPDANIVQHVTLNGSATPACPTVGTYQLPTAGSGPWNLIHIGAGNSDIWVTASRPPSVGLIDISQTATHTITSAPTEYLLSPW